MHFAIGKARSTPKFTKGMCEFGNWSVTDNVALSASHPTNARCLGGRKSSSLAVGLTEGARVRILMPITLTHSGGDPQATAWGYLPTIRQPKAHPPEGWTNGHLRSSERVRACREAVLKDRIRPRRAEFIRNGPGLWR